jgi:hypothetical protein
MIFGRIRCINSLLSHDRAKSSETLPLVVLAEFSDRAFRE